MNFLFPLTHFHDSFLADILDIRVNIPNHPGNLSYAQKT